MTKRKGDGAEVLEDARQGWDGLGSMGFPGRAHEMGGSIERLELSRGQPPDRTRAIGGAVHR